MRGNFGKISGATLLLIISYTFAEAQISPGDLSSLHSHLEGLSNCTQCHVLGNKVSNEKCLGCHREIENRITLKKGYHVSAEAEGKQCTACHSDHNGKNFKLIRLDSLKFNHDLTGFSLSVPHGKKTCKECHDIRFVADENIKKKKITYLGLSTGCLTCHSDYHRKTLSEECLSCHTPDAFKPAAKFNHASTRFQLAGKHKSVDCSKCHKIQITEGKKFQEFRLTGNRTCSDCHKDPHQNKFGQECSKCHNENSFQAVGGEKNFDHNKTGFKLEEKHLTINCKACHKGKLTDPLKFSRCTDCHADYHNNQFAKNGKSPDCSQCHSVKGFTQFSFTLEQHNRSNFALKGSHLAVPCSDCHKKQKEWSFGGIGIDCKDCHKDIHQGLIEVKYYPESNCKVCHNESRWADVAFDHSKTGFQLTGAHTNVTCRGCHIIKDAGGAPQHEYNGSLQQRFSGLSANCSVCHADKHFRQFEKNGVTNCTQCHDTRDWKASGFNHNDTQFKLDGKHINVPCVKCHKPQQEGASLYIRYRLKVFTCESCHS